MKLFDFLKCINHTKNNPLRDEYGDDSKGDYKPYIINRCLSYFPDTIFYANEMNMRSSCDITMQFEYYLNNIRKRKRYSPWLKKEESLVVDAIKGYFDCSEKKARDYEKILSEDIKNDIIKRMENIKNPK